MYPRANELGLVALNEDPSQTTTFANRSHYKTRYDSHSATEWGFFNIVKNHSVADARALIML